MSKKKIRTRPTSKDGRYPAFWDFIKTDNYDVFQGTFFSELDHWLTLLNTPRRWLKDNGHKKFLNLLGYEIEEKEGKIGIGLAHGQLLSMYQNIVNLAGKEKAKDYIYLFKKRLGFYKVIGKRPIPQFEYYLRLAMRYEVHLYIFEDPLAIRELGNQTMRGLLITVRFGDSLFYTKKEGLQTSGNGTLYSIFSSLRSNISVNWDIGGSNPGPAD